jgi:hypothetical protein
VIMTRGGMIADFRSLLMSRCAARVSLDVAPLRRCFADRVRDAQDLDRCIRAEADPAGEWVVACRPPPGGPYQDPNRGSLNVRLARRSLRLAALIK